MRKWSLALVLGSLLAGASAARACCPASPRDLPVKISRQAILVAWNAGTKVEHFVRRATFDAAGDMKDFGFLVPTPAKPELAEAPDGVFDLLANAIRPEERTEYDDDYYFSFLMAPRSRNADGGPLMSERTLGAPRAADVRVLEEVRVAGYDAAVLEADDAQALAKWLGDHGYDARPEIQDWVEPYVAARWKVTAFKYAGGQGPGRGLATGAIRMTFPTDRPLFPYRVPKDMRDGHDTLRVYYVGKERVDGTLGEKAAPWTKETKFSKEVATLPELLKGAVPADQPVGGTWLTAFDDSRWPGGSEDLYFAPGPEKAPLVPPPIIHRVRRTSYVPVDLGCVVLLLGFGVSRAVKRARRKA
jgi:hypothetical protein